MILFHNHMISEHYLKSEQSVWGGVLLSRVEVCAWKVVGSDPVVGREIISQIGP